MNKKATKSKESVQVSEHGLLSLVAAKLKNRDLFPQKTESAKKYLQKLKAANS